MDTTIERLQMVERQLKRRGIADTSVLRAMAKVPREALLGNDIAEFAYRDSPLPISAGQTMSQPYIVALMAERLELQPGQRVLEIGTGSGYAAAIFAEIAEHVYTIERHEELAAQAKANLHKLGYRNIEVKVGDGTLGWPEHAPFDAIAVGAGGPKVPPALLEQLKIGGRLVMPVGPERMQELVRITRKSEREYRHEELGPVTFVPLIGEQGWTAPGQRTIKGTLPFGTRLAPVVRSTSNKQPVAALIAECAENFSTIESANLDPLLDRIGDARVVLLGESTHGTSEFYRMRSRITQELITKRGFTIVAAEADWPDAAQLNGYITHQFEPRAWKPFSRFPTWMWRNQETVDFSDWLHEYNNDPAEKIRFAGLDLYSLYISASEVINYLRKIDPNAAAVARERYGCLTPWQHDPGVYARSVLTGRIQSCEDGIVAMLQELLQKRLPYIAKDGENFFDAERNASVVATAERYYRSSLFSSVSSWNLRDQHMFETLQALLRHRGESTKVVVWAHNSHVGNARATEMAGRGEFNLGQLCGEAFAESCYSIGFGTDTGTVAAAEEWDGSMQRMSIRPSQPRSVERLCVDSARDAFLLPLRHPRREALREELLEPRLQRAIGVVYRPESELMSHYFQTVLPRQFDEYIWFRTTTAVTAPARSSTSSFHPLVA